MAKQLRVERLTLTFPEGWIASKYDDWPFYRKQFSKQRDGLKAVDVLARDGKRTAFLIELKDYRHPDTIKPSQLPHDIADKVLMTLAAMLPARLNAEPGYKEVAQAVLTCRKLRVIAHVEQPRAHLPVIDPADLKQKLAQLLHAVDAHPSVVSSTNMRNVGWSVALRE